MENTQPILIKAFELLKVIIQSIRHYPRDQKFLLGRHTQQITSALLDTLIEAWYSAQADKKPLLQKANILLEKLRFYIRLAFEQGYFNSNKYKELSEKIEEIGRMNGGWLKSLNR